MILDIRDLFPNFMCVRVSREFTFAQTRLSLCEREREEREERERERERERGREGGREGGRERERERERGERCRFFYEYHHFFQSLRTPLRISKFRVDLCKSGPSVTITI